MNTHNEQLKKLENLRLGGEARTRMRTDLSAYATYNPVRDGDLERSREHIQHVSVWSVLFGQSHTRPMYIQAFLVGALILGGGTTSLAAQQSLPGDALYPVKINVNESVRAALAVGANAEARFQADLLEERVEEAEALEAEGRYDAEAGARVVAQAEAVSRTSASADAEVQADIRADLGTTLSALRSDADDQSGGTAAGTEEAGAVGLGATIDTALGIVVSGGSDTEAAGAANLIARAEEAEAHIEEIRAAVRTSTTLSASARVQIEASLESASAYVLDARASLAADATDRSQASLDAAVELLGEIEATLRSNSNIQIDLGTGADIDPDDSGAGVSGSGSVESATRIDL